MAGTSFYMFSFRFIQELFSALSAVFLYGQAFVCFSACLAVHCFAFSSILASLMKQTLTATAEYNGCVSVRYVHFFAALYKSSQNNNVK